MAIDIVKFKHNYNPEYQIRSVNVNLGRCFFTFSAVLAEQIGLVGGKYVDIAQDTETGKWYMSEPFDKQDNERGSRLYSNTYHGRYGKTFCYRLFNALAARKICDEVGATKGCTLMVASRAKVENGRKWYKIFTDKPLKVSNIQFNFNAMPEA